MAGDNPLLIEFHAQLEAAKEEIRREVAERMTHLQRENDVLRSHVQSVVSIASNSMINRRSDVGTAVVRLDLGFTPAATDPPAMTMDHVSLTLGLSPSGEPQPTVISQVTPYTPLIPETTPAPSIPTCFFPESLRPGSRTTDLHSTTQSIQMVSAMSAPTEPSVPHYISRNHGEPGPSSFVQNRRRNIFDDLLPEVQTQRPRRPVTLTDQNCGGRRPEIIFIPSPTRPGATQMAGPTVPTGGLLQPGMADTMSMIMDQLRQMQERINAIPGVPPPLDIASQTCYEDSPFDGSIIRVELPNKFDIPTMDPFDGTTDPGEHVARYKQVMSTVSVRTEWKRHVCVVDSA
ncbi:unnamed protein product [Cuscuta europaea]|uniref:Uncharacterized protein n=1 Tax=Cuscuta europaea TaxID=41803 RepID=A0A9P1E357_CUSEU|nr:unnamed protein product [Cuscuta europaea]